MNRDPTKIVLDRLSFHKLADLAKDGAWERGGDGSAPREFFIPGNHPRLRSPSTGIDGGMPMITIRQMLDNIIEANPFLLEEQHVLDLEEGKAA